jgi:hypothetical protein
MNIEKGAMVDFLSVSFFSWRRKRIALLVSFHFLENQIESSWLISSQ